MISCHEFNVEILHVNISFALSFIISCQVLYYSNSNVAQFHFTIALFAHNSNNSGVTIARNCCEYCKSFNKNESQCGTKSFLYKELYILFTHINI